MHNQPQTCYVCGSPNEFGYSQDSFAVLRELICQHCGASLRNSSMAKTILKSLKSSAKCLSDAVSDGSLDDQKIYEVGSSGILHNILKKVPGYVCSEFKQNIFFPVDKIEIQNLQELTFANEIFDLVITQDVLEHVSNFHHAFKEINRVLKKGGKHIFTIPLHEGKKTRIRTTIFDYFLLPPIYHGDYQNSAGSLVYTDFGNDVLDILTQFNFSSNFVRHNTWYQPQDITDIISVEQYLEFKKTSYQKFHWQYNDIVIVSEKETNISETSQFTGERFLPEITSPKISYEHLHRYLYAAGLATGKVVLDIACGDGYGTNLLAKSATKVFGVDIDKEQIKLAEQKYTSTNIQFQTGSVEKFNFDNNSIDLIVSFETIEHVSKELQAKFILECQRVLKDTGILILSTPNKYQYSDISNYSNEYHQHEFYQEELVAFIKKYFPSFQLFGQNIFESSQIWNIQKPQPNSQEFLYQITPSGFKVSEYQKSPDYFIIVCSNQELTSKQFDFSLFTDISHSYFLDIKNRYVDYKNQSEQLIQEIQILKNRLSILESSTSWQITQPLRSGMDFLKKSTINTRIQTKRQLDKLAPYIPQPIKTTIKPVYHRLFSGIPNNSVLQLTLDKVDPDLIDDTLHRETMLDIFVFPVIDWYGRYQRPQQIISRLAKRGHRVFYFSPTFNRTNSTDLEKSIKIGNICENIYQIQLPSTQDINIYQDTLAPDQVNILQKSISIIKDKFKIGHSVSIVHQPFWFSLVKTISRNKIVYDCMDDHSGFSTNTTKQSDLENDLLSSSDCVITTSVSLHQKAHEYNQNTALIRNGSDIKHFANLPSCQESLIKKPIIGYYGAISDWFDCELVARCAKHYPNYSFVLIGNTYGADLRPIENLPNVHLLGEKKYEELPNLLSCFDVCLIPFKINNLTLATNPVKFYEYISSGKAVVTVELPELKDHQDICYFSKSQQEFIDNIQKALDENDNEIISKRKAVALANSWKSRVDDFEKKIYQLYPSVSIVIVTFGNLEYTKNCLESIFKYSRYPNYELIIIDNNSSDSTPAYLQEISDIFPNIKIILNQDNKGFAKANNQGIKIAKGEYIIPLNNDTIVTNDWIWGMVYHMETNPDIGLLGPVTNSIGNEQKIDVDYRDIEGMQQFAWKYTRKNQDIINENKMLALFCTIARKSDLEKVGLLSEEYEVGMFEDDDLSYKFKQIDKKIVMTDDVFVHHIGRASFAKLDDQKYMQIFNKNKAIFEDKWGPWIPHQPRKRKDDTLGKNITG